MTTCQSCDATNAPDAKNCDQCGTPLVPAGSEPYAAGADETSSCDGCGLMNETDAVYCDQCGNVMDEASGTSATTGLDEGYYSANFPRDNLVRAISAGVELRADGSGEPNVLTGHFSKFNSWYPIESQWEGRFHERVLPGAFADTIKSDRSNMRVLFDHGFDPHIGGKPLGPIRTLKEDDQGAYYEVPLLDTDYNRNFVVPALTGTLMSGEKVGSQLGASFRFQVQDDSWNYKPKATQRNPEGLPERSITRAKVFEFGPVVFPANPGASASARSLSDEWMARLVRDRKAFDAFRDRVGDKVAERVVQSVPEDVRAVLQTPEAIRRRDRRRRLAAAAFTLG